MRIFRMESKVRNFDGLGDVKVFLEKVKLLSSLKGYQQEKAAQNLASKLEGRAFDVYMRLSTEDKKDVEKIETELLKEFERGRQDRDTAIFELNNRKRKPDESYQTFAFKIIELIKLAYPTFDDNTRKTIAKDYFIKGLHSKMQIALKALPHFEKASIDILTTEANRLQLAGIQSFTSDNNQHCMNVNNSLVDEIAEKVMEKMKGISIDVPGAADGGNNATAFATFSGPRPAQNWKRGGRGSISARPRWQKYRSTQQQPRKCRNCQSSDHLVRDCPTRFQRT